MNLSELRDLIRFEAEVAGLGEYTNFIDPVINQELQEITGKSKYKELWDQHIYTIPSDESFEFSLPTDLQHLDSVFFAPIDNPISDSGYQLFTGTPIGLARQNEGSPRYFYSTGTLLRIYPYTSVYANDVITLSYYKKPSLSVDTDAFPVPSIEKAVQQRVAARLLALKDSKRSVLMSQQAERAYLGSRSPNA